MILTGMKPNLTSQTPIQQREIFEAYLIIRDKDMTMPVVKPLTKGAKKKGGKQIKLTTELYNLLKTLGLV